MPVLIIGNGRIAADETKLIHPRLHIHAAGAMPCQHAEIIERPQRRDEGIADAGPSAAGE